MNDTESVDYVPTLHLGYEKVISKRETSTSKRARYWSDKDLAGALTAKEKRQVVGIDTAVVAAEVIVGTQQQQRK